MNHSIRRICRRLTAAASARVLLAMLPLSIIFELLVSTAAFATLSPCTGDRLKFCKDVKAAPEDVLACLLQHKDELSEACKARLGK